jgi:hypothetical protein
VYRNLFYMLTDIFALHVIDEIIGFAVMRDLYCEFSRGADAMAASLMVNDARDKALNHLFSLLKIRNVRDWSHAVGKQLAISESEMYLHGTMTLLRSLLQSEMMDAITDGDDDVWERVFLAELKEKSVLKKLKQPHLSALLLLLADVPVSLTDFDCTFKLGWLMGSEQFNLSGRQLDLLFTTHLQLFAADVETSVMLKSAKSSEAADSTATNWIRNRSRNIGKLAQDLSLFISALEYLPVTMRYQFRYRQLFTYEPSLTVLGDCVASVLLSLETDDVGFGGFLGSLVSSTRESLSASSSLQLVEVLQTATSVAKNILIVHSTIAADASTAVEDSSDNDLHERWQSVVSKLCQLAVPGDVASADRTAIETTVTKAVEALWLSLCEDNINLDPLLVSNSDVSSNRVVASLISRLEILENITTLCAASSVQGVANVPLQLRHQAKALNALLLIADIWSLLNPLVDYPKHQVSGNVCREEKSLQSLLTDRGAGPRLVWTRMNELVCANITTDCNEENDNGSKRTIIRQLILLARLLFRCDECQDLAMRSLDQPLQQLTKISSLSCIIWEHPEASSIQSNGSNDGCLDLLTICFDSGMFDLAFDVLMVDLLVFQGGQSVGDSLHFSLLQKDQAIANFDGTLVTTLLGQWTTMSVLEKAQVKLV